MTVFTLCSSKEYMPKAQVAIDSIKKHHPRAKIDLRNEEDNFPRKRMEQVLDWLKKGKQVVALGADCVLYAPLTTLIGPLDADWINCVLTPHVVNPPKDRVTQIYETGHANGDCIGLNSNKETIAAIEWILEQPLKEGPGQFYEQTPLSALPFILDGVVVNRDPTVNCAWYNMHEREIKTTQYGYLVNDKPLTMFQFSGYDSTKLSKYWPNPTVTPALAKLMREYEASIEKASLSLHA